MRIKHKDCFVNGHCCYDCPNFQCDEFENRYDLPVSEIGLERIECKHCYMNTGECDDCLFQGCEECPEVHKNEHK